MLGGGRGKKEDSIDHGVGLEFHKRIGDRGARPAKSWSQSTTIPRQNFAEARKLIADSFEIGDHQPPMPPLIRQVIGG